VDALAAAAGVAGSGGAAAVGAAAQPPATEAKVADNAAGSGHSIKLKEKFFARAEGMGNA
jgi:hypothetical protein